MAINTSPEAMRDRTLAEAIQLATRVVHARLNTLIIARLPLALPPKAADPSAYLAGLLHIAPIYVTFETLWEDLVSRTLPPDTPPSLHDQDGAPPPYAHHQAKPMLDERLHHLLHHLKLPELMRSDRLRADIRSLTGWSDHQVETELRNTSRTGRLGDFINHIKRVIDRKPHVLIAYSYIMFMALFAGGRFIRSSLKSAGSDFWSQSHTGQSDSSAPQQHSQGDATAHDAMPLRFFHFTTPHDGEELKREFKQRLLQAEDVLTAKERSDVIQEAICIFDNMALLVQQLDMACSSDAASLFLPASTSSTALSAAAATVPPTSRTSSLAQHPRVGGGRFRDSVVVTRERRARSSVRRSSGSESDAKPLTHLRRSHCQRSEPVDLLAIPVPATTLHSHHHHPTIPALSGLNSLELCPALAKSVRFDRNLETPQQQQRRRGPQQLPELAKSSSLELTGSVRFISKGLCDMHVTNWVIVAAFGAMIFGALMTGGRGLLHTDVFVIPH